MLRWNGWGHDAITYPLSEAVRVYLSAHLGAPEPPVNRFWLYCNALTMMAMTGRAKNCPGSTT